MELVKGKRMKKVNVIFIVECIIIVLLLMTVGALLKNNSKNSVAKEIATEEEAVEEAEISLDATEESNMTVVGSSGVVKVSEIANASSEIKSDIANTTQENVPLNPELSVSENMLQMGKTLYGKKIVVFGDSIWNAARGKDGISEYIQQETGATVYNCAIGGTTAALVDGENSMENWTSNCFNGMIYMARNLVPASKVLGDNVVYDIIKQVDFNQTDYVIVAYGLNDFFSDVSIYPTEYYEITNYVGALRNGIAKLKENYPHLKIIIVSPTYTKMFEGEKELEIGDYVEAARGVAAEMDVEFLDMFHILGNNEESRTSHLGDGVHMSAEGRKVYSSAVIHFLNKLEVESVE